jgi:hypothetical protein
LEPLDPFEFSGDESRDWMKENVLDQDLFPGLAGYLSERLSDWSEQNPRKRINGHSVNQWRNLLSAWDDLEPEDVLSLGEELKVWDVL